MYPTGWKDMHNIIQQPEFTDLNMSELRFLEFNYIVTSKISKFQLLWKISSHRVCFLLSKNYVINIVGLQYFGLQWTRVVSVLPTTKPYLCIPVLQILFGTFDKIRESSELFLWNRLCSYHQCPQTKLQNIISSIYDCNVDNTLSAQTPKTYPNWHRPEPQNKPARNKNPLIPNMTVSVVSDIGFLYVAYKVLPRCPMKFIALSHRI